MTHRTPNRTLQDKVRFLHAYDCAKHNLAPDPDAYADAKINQMTNAEFLAALSEALSETLEELK